MSDSPPAEDPVLQGGDADAAEQDAPAFNPPADDADAPNDGEDNNADLGGDFAAATAAAAAVAARLMAEHVSLRQASAAVPGAEHPGLLDRMCVPQFSQQTCS
jgi:hypothetical protein